MINFLERAVPHLFPLPLLLAFSFPIENISWKRALTQFFSVKPQNITLVHQPSRYLLSFPCSSYIILIFKSTSPRWFSMSHCKDPCVIAFCPVIGVSENPCLHYECTQIHHHRPTICVSKRQQNKMRHFFVCLYIGSVTQQIPTRDISS